MLSLGAFSFLQLTVKKNGTPFSNLPLKESMSSPSSEHNVPEVGTTEDVQAADKQQPNVYNIKAEPDQAEDQEQPISEYEAAEDQVEPQATPEEAAQQLRPSTSPEQTLLLQLLRRAKRQQELIAQVQKGLKALANVEKNIGKATEQIKQLQLTAKDTQKEIVQIQRQITTVKQEQERNFQRLMKQHHKQSSIKASSKSRKNRR
jgi:hypothetical protein